MPENSNGPDLLPVQIVLQTIPPSDEKSEVSKITVEQNSIESQLRKSICMILGVKNEDLESEQLLVDAGLDSYGFVELILEIEERYSISFTEEELVSGSLSSIMKIVAIIEAKKSAS